MNDGQVREYAAQADKLERDPIGPDGGGRAVVVNGRGFQKWQRMHPGEKLTWIDDADGRPRALTPKQKAILYSALAHCGETIPIRSLAAEVNVAASSVSRALVKLASFGLIAYLTGRGRYAGTLILRRVKGDGLDRFRELAKAKVRAWAKAAEARVSRLWINVAPYALEERGYHNPYYFNIMSNTTYKGATLTAQPFSVEELRDAGII